MVVSLTHSSILNFPSLLWSGITKNELMQKMALKTQFPVFAPPQLLPQPHRPATEIRFSRWNSANKSRRDKSQKDLDDQLRIEKRFDSALTIVQNYNPSPPHPTTFKSAGTPSAPSSPSIPGKSSKYSTNPSTHPAFKPLSKPRSLPLDETEKTPQKPEFRIDDNGISYEMPEAPFLYQYSYTETPNVKPVKLREPLVSPFGPQTMPKPWLGRRPLPPSKKKLPEFDSFRLPPPNKKGVKPVQAPGPFLPGSGPKYVRSREEVLGEPLTKEEIEALIDGCRKSTRQLNMGRDGLTHNMLDNIHDLWKRRRVCKIKCKGVCTVDMDNVCQQLEEKTGGKIIYSRGGVIYLFRGRNYNYRSRPRFPLMLWKPVAPVYPRLVQQIPDGLTLKQASEMRKRGRELIPICKLAKNGVYCDLVDNVREAFEACELVRINCQGLNPSDYRKIGAKLKDLVPCVLLSFEREHILVWRGHDWKSSLEPTESPKVLQKVETDVAPGLSAATPSVSNEEKYNDLEETIPHDDLEETIPSTCSNAKSQVDSLLLTEAEAEDTTSLVGTDTSAGSCEHPSEPCNQATEIEVELDDSAESQSGTEKTVLLEQLIITASGNEQMSPKKPCTEEIMLLRKQAVENGMAVVLDRDSLDADIVFRKAVSFAKTAPAGPVFCRRAKQLAVQKSETVELGLKEESQVVSSPEMVVGSQRDERKSSSSSRSKKMEDIKGDYLKVVPQGNLRVDELAKLLA